MAAVVWSDVIQMVVLLVGLVLCIVLALDMVGGLGPAIAVHDSARLAAIDPGHGLGDGAQAPMWGFVLGGFVLYVSYYGVDQSQAQRELSAPTTADTKRSLVFQRPGPVPDDRPLYGPRARGRSGLSRQPGAAGGGVQRSPRSPRAAVRAPRAPDRGQGHPVRSDPRGGDVQPRLGPQLVVGLDDARLHRAVLAGGRRPRQGQRPDAAALEDSPRWRGALR